MKSGRHPILDAARFLPLRGTKGALVRNIHKRTPRGTLREGSAAAGVCKECGGCGRRPQERAAGEGRSPKRRFKQEAPAKNHPRESPARDTKGGFARDIKEGTHGRNRGEHHGDTYGERPQGTPARNARKERPQGTPARNARKERQQELTSKGSHQTRSVRKRSIYENPQENRSAEDCPDRQSSALFLQNGWFLFLLAFPLRIVCAIPARHDGTGQADRRSKWRGGSGRFRRAESRDGEAAHFTGAASAGCVTDFGAGGQSPLSAIRRRTAARSGMAGMAPRFSTHREAAAFPKRAKDWKSSNVI